MDIRNVQKTGKMYYVYMPTQWCKDQGVGAESKVVLLYKDDGSLAIYPNRVEKERSEINITISETDEDIIHKLIVACFINPASKFKIKLEKKIDYKKLLNQKKLISLELVEVARDSVTCDSSVTSSDPGSLLNTMIRKIRNLVIIMTKNYNQELIQKYEEEIDRSKLLIDKSTIEALTFSYGTHQLKSIEVHYISLMAKDLERFVDHLIILDKKETGFLNNVLDIVDTLKDIMETTLNTSKGLDLTDALAFVKKIEAIKEPKQTEKNYADKKRMKGYMSNIAEVIIDWSITSYIMKKGDKIKKV
jgi:phosphate uptake regulator